ncbi:MAG: protein kinase [Chloroflexi bacterium]|nr:protein kinase [Chloroflexota bacterium]
MIGNKIAGHYQIEAEIGSGGMGTVYCGLDTRTHEQVAIKHLKPEMARADLIERFKREGAALRNLNHPNIVKMLDAVEEKGNHYLILEYLSGGDLGAVLDHESLPVERVIKLAIEIADALTRAHHLNIIHRDLKPGNVLLAEDGTPRLTDFGIAHIASKNRITDTDVIVGTVDYLAPEVLSGGTVGPQADIWAFGVMLFEMLSGERPFEGETLTATITAIMTAPIPDLEKLRPDTPVALVDLVYRMLARDLQSRVRSVRQVGLELEDILHGRDYIPVATRFDPDTAVDTTIIHRRRHNLPVQTTPFVGREVELGELTKLIRDPAIRLLTIVAPGGMGKTRLALEAARQYMDDSQPTLFANSAFVVELAPISDAGSIVSAIADATDYKFQADGREQKAQLLNFLANKDLLLVMDNFEHLLDGAGLVIDILHAAPNVKILATSRQRLTQPGETVFHLSGMDFPDWETPEDALEYAAVKLFMNSAQRARPGFELTEDNLDYVARICGLVEGMPLGIVLAGAWLTMLTPQEIAAEIEQSIDFLQSTGGEVPERQHSIRAVFDQSWQMLGQRRPGCWVKPSSRFL